MIIEPRSICEDPESNGWEIHWKSQSFETAYEILDNVQAGTESTHRRYRCPGVANISQRFRHTKEFPMVSWRLVGKEDSTRAAMQLRDKPNQDRVERACVVESRDLNVPWAVMAMD